MVTIRNRPRPESQFVDVFDEDQVQKAIIYRKAKYDEGAEKVQSQINQLGQLPTITPEDAKIVQDKVTNLTSNINSIAGLDLSNQFNINKVSSMSSDITNDPTIQAAVSSARNLQKNQKFIDDAKQNPKKFGDVVRVQNEDDFYGQLQKHKEDRASGKDSIFSYTYKPYRDVEGILSKEMEKIKSDITMGMSGNYFNKDETITPQRIREIAFNRINSDPSLSEQVRINSSYSTKGVTDEQLLNSKNRIQITELNNRKNALEKQMTSLYSVDLKNVKGTSELLEKAKKKMLDYDNYSKLLTSNPNKIIDLETGEPTKNYNRKQLAYELSMYATADGLTSKFAFNKRTISANPIPLKEVELNWEMQMRKLDYNIDLREQYRKEQDSNIDNQLKALEIKKVTKVGDDGQVSYGSPDLSTAITESPEVMMTGMITDAKTETTGLLKKAILDKFSSIQGLAGSGASSQFLDKYVDSMLTPDGQLKYLGEDANIKVLQSGAKSTTGIVPDAKILREGIKFFNRLSRDVKGVWNNDKTISIENAQLMKDYADGIHRVGVLQEANNFASQAGLTATGMTKEEYNRLNGNYIKQKEYSRTYPGYSAPNQASLFSSDMLNPKEKEKVEAYNVAKANYFTQRIAVAKMYPVINFDPKDEKTDFMVQNDFSRAIKSGVGADITGKASVNKIYGKVDKWSEHAFGNDAVIRTKSYEPRSSIATTIVTSGKGAEKIEEELKFYVPNALVARHIPEKEKQASQPLSLDDALNFSDSGKLQVRTYDKSKKEYVLKDVWKTTVNTIPLTWKPQKTFPKDVGNTEVKVFLQLPYNGNTQVVEIDEKYSSATAAEAKLTSVVNESIILLKRQGYNDAQVKQELLKYFQKINGR